MRADEKLTAFLELESAIQANGAVGFIDKTTAVTARASANARQAQKTEPSEDCPYDSNPVAEGHD